MSGENQILYEDYPGGSKRVGTQNPLPVNVVSSGSSGGGVTVSGISTMAGPFGELLTGIKRDDIAVDFQYDVINTFFDCKPAVLTGDGQAIAQNSLAIVSSASVGTAELHSRDTIRYIPGHSGYSDFTFYCGGSSGKGRAGAADNEDGFFVEYDIDASQWRFGYRRNSVDTVVDFSDESMDNTSLRIFRIWFGYLGVANPVLMTKDGNWKTVATINTENNNSGETHVLRPVFPMFIYAENGAEVRSGSWDGGTLGGVIENSGNRTFSFPNALLVNGTALEPGTMTLTSSNVGTIAIINLKSTFQGKTNKVKGRLLKWQVGVLPGATGSGEIIFQLLALPQLSGTPSYTDVDSTNSTSEVDHSAGTGASVSVTGPGRVLQQQEVYYESGGFFSPAIVTFAQEDADRLGLVGYPGEYFAITAKDRGGNGVTVRTEINWEELF